MFRVLHDPALDGPTNMARDEALMHGVGGLASPPTLRLYQWAVPTLSLGYFQPFADTSLLRKPVADLPVVRRLTGGGAILHDIELTYSVAIPVDHPLVYGKPNELYRLMHEAVMAALAGLGVTAIPCGITDDSGPRRGPFFCFARRHEFDLLVGADKIVGSAQRRTREAILQHGSIVVANRFAEQPTASLSLPPDQAISALRSSLAEQFGSVTNEALGPGEWTEAELASAQSLHTKYAGSVWTQRV